MNQRARWINTWFKYAGNGVKLVGTGMLNLNWNQFLCGVVFSRPPLFITVAFTGIFMLTDLFIFPELLFFWVFCIAGFFTIFFIALSYFHAPKAIYNALFSIPKFISLQFISLIKSKSANKISTATVHYYERKIDDVEQAEKNDL